MLRRFLATGMLIALLAWSGEISAQSDELRRAYDQGIKLFKAGRYNEALPYYRKALKLGERKFGPSHPTTATLLNNLAKLYRTQGLYKTA